MICQAFTAVGLPLPSREGGLSDRYETRQAKTQEVYGVFNSVM